MKYFQNANLKHNMSILSVKALTDAVNRATVHSDDEAFKLVVEYVIYECLLYLFLSYLFRFYKRGFLQHFLVTSPF